MSASLYGDSKAHYQKCMVIDSEKPLLEKKDLENIQEKMDKLKVPASVGRMPKKIQNSYGGFTADQWKTLKTLFSIYALWNLLPSSDLELWQGLFLSVFSSYHKNKGVTGSLLSFEILPEF